MNLMRSGTGMDDGLVCAFAFSSLPVDIGCKPKGCAPAGQGADVDRLICIVSLPEIDIRRIQRVPGGQIGF